MKTSLFLFIFLISATVAAAQTWKDTITLIENIFDRYKAQNPGCQLAISRNGELIFSEAWGMADLEHKAPLTTTSLIEAGSVSKQFTAAAILLLEQQHKLSLDDDVRKFIPEIPDYGTPVTLRQMLHHTSGLKDWGSLMALSDWPRGTKTYSNEDVLHIMSHQHSLNHKPGEEFLYSNSNYVLFAIIIERVSGMTLAEYSRINIFTPAGMTHTEWRTDYKKVVPNRAIAYGKNNGVYFTDMPNENVYGNGGLLTTAEDLLRWNNYYLSNKLGNPGLLQQQLSTRPLNNGNINSYAAGLRIDSINGWKVIIHDGATAAYRSILEYYPSQGLSVAWLANTSEFDGVPDGTGDLRNLLLKNRITSSSSAFSKAKQESTFYNIEPSSLQEYAGEYYSDEVEAKLTISIKDNVLIIHRYPKTEYTLVAVSKDAFKIANSKVTVSFERGNGNQISVLKFYTPRVRNVAFKKL